MLSRVLNDSQMLTKFRNTLCLGGAQIDAHFLLLPKMGGETVWRGSILLDSAPTLPPLSKLACIRYKIYISISFFLCMITSVHPVAFSVIIHLSKTLVRTNANDGWWLPIVCFPPPQPDPTQPFAPTSSPCLPQPDPRLSPTLYPPFLNKFMSARSGYWTIYTVVLPRGTWLSVVSYNLTS